MCEIMWHYCSLSSFLKIVTTNKIKFSNILSTNDKSELNYFLDELSKKENYYNYFNKVLLNTNNFYSFSLSMKKDDLYMWNTYANEGVAIGFDIGILKKDFENLNVELISGKIEYKDLGSINDYIGEELKRISDENKNKKIKETKHLNFLEKSYLVKNDAFSLEKEYRFIFGINKDVNDISLGKDYCKKEYDINIYKGISDFFLIPFSKTSIKKLIVSPKSKLSNEDASRLMENLGYNLDYVHNSTISIR